MALVGDYIGGPFIGFPILFVVPVVYTSWSLSRRWAVGLAVLLPACRLGFISYWDVPWGAGYSVANAIIQVVVLTILVSLIQTVTQKTHDLERDAGILRGMLHICAFCKKIRDHGGSWQPLEAVIAARSEARFSHGYCDECMHTHYPGFTPTDSPHSGSAQEPG